MTGEIATKEYFMNELEEISRRLTEQDLKLTSLEKEVDLKIEKSENFVEPPAGYKKKKSPYETKTIPEIKEDINIFLGIYGPLKTDVNHLLSARSSFNLSEEELKEARALKMTSYNLQIRSNKIYNECTRQLGLTRI